MTSWAQPFLPFFVLLGRISAFFAVLPIFSSRSVPARIRVLAALLVTMFAAMILPPAPAALANLSGAAMALLVAGEALCGLSLGLAVRLVFNAVQVGGLIASRQMGFAMAGTYDPSTGEQTQPMSVFLETLFMLFFLVASGHHLLLRLIFRSFTVFPVGEIPTAASMAQGIITAGTTMLTFGLQLAAPVLAAFICLSVFLAVLARVLPELNVLLLSLPLRVGLGLFMASAMIPGLNRFTHEFALWMQSLMTA